MLAYRCAAHGYLVCLLVPKHTVFRLPAPPHAYSIVCKPGVLVALPWEIVSNIIVVATDKHLGARNHPELIVGVAIQSDLFSRFCENFSSKM